MSKKKLYCVEYTDYDPQQNMLEIVASSEKEARMLAKEEIEDGYTENYKIDKIKKIETLR